MTLQSVASIVRQVLAYAAGIAGVVTASVPALHLPTDVSAVLVGFAGLILGIEHYVGDPSTGSTVDTTAQTKSLQ